jgi:hypothetical protein
VPWKEAEPVTVDEWERIVLRLNANFPGQQLEPPTAVEWFGPLSAFPVGEVWDAIDTLRRTSDYLPSLKAILAAIDTNWRERSAARRALEAQEARTARTKLGGVIMPPETRQAIEVLKDSIAGRIDKALARKRIDDLADQLAERVDREQMGQLS